MSEESEKVDIIVSGHLCLDLIPKMDSVALENLASPGRLFEVGALTIGTGGAVSNTGLALHRLGADVRLMATVGDDLLGRVIIAALKDRDPRLAEFITTQPGGASSYSVVLSPARVDRIFLHCTGTNSAFDASHIRFDLLQNARIFHLGYPPILPRLITRNGEQLTAIYREAQAAGVVTSLDMAVPDPDGPSGQVDWSAIIHNAVPYVDVFLPSIDEIVFMLRRVDFDNWQGAILDHIDAAYLSALADELLALGPAIVGFKLGAMGIYLKTAPADRISRLQRLNLDGETWGDFEHWIPAYRVEVVSAVGAGDSAYAGFLAALLHGLPPEAAMRWASAVGACNVEAADATSGVQDWAATQARMDAGWSVQPGKLNGI